MLNTASNATESEAWVLRYKRLMLDHLGAPSDVDLSTVSITPSHNEAYRYSEYTSEPASFDIDVRWEYRLPGAYTDVPEGNGLYQHYRELRNEEVAAFLGTLA